MSKQRNIARSCERVILRNKNFKAEPVFDELEQAILREQAERRAFLSKDAPTRERESHANQPKN